MKISEAIAYLQDGLEKYGDVDVFVDRVHLHEPLILANREKNHILIDSWGEHSEEVRKRNRETSSNQ